MTAPGAPSAASGNPAAPAHANRDTARRVVPLFRPYRAQVAAVVGLIVLTSTIGIINPLLIQAVFNKALFVPGGPKLHLLYLLVGIMAAVPIVNGAIGILQTYQTTRVGQQVMRDLRDRSTRTCKRSRLPSSPAPKPARSNPGWPTTWAVSSRWSPPLLRASWPTSSSSCPPSWP
jgi:ABC-type bacteriocin/lantibiotic exporter with double-glycine peptidase domain